MQNDVRQQYQQSLDESHFGHPTVIENVHTGSRGRPSIHIDPEFLRWSYSLRSITGIADFLGVSRRLVRQQLLDYGIVEPQLQPVNLSSGNSTLTTGDNDDLLDPLGTGASSGSLILTTGDNDDLLDPLDTRALTPVDDNPGLAITSYTAPQSQINSDELDTLISQLRHHFRRAGVSMLMGMLRRLGYRIPREHVRQSLLRIDPVHRVFDRIRIRRRVYRVPGPNSLWHHDGQHGMHNIFIWQTISFNSNPRSYPVGHSNSWFY